MDTTAKTERSDLGSFGEMSDSKALGVKFISFPYLKEIQEMRTTRVKNYSSVKDFYILLIFFLQKYLTAKTKTNKTS